MSRNLIFGAIEGYEFEQIAPFFQSLRNVNYTGDIVIFHRELDPVSVEKLTAFGVTPIALPSKGLTNPLTGHRHTGQGFLGDILALGLRVINTMPVPQMARETWSVRFAEQFFHIANLRFTLAERYLRKNSGSYSHVMISDVRDVIFQADPFDYDEIDELSTFLEGPDFTIEKSANYRAWLESALGADAVAPYRNAPISCCAITIGPAPGMLKYLAAMSAAILHNYTRQPYLFGLDSAAHNNLCFKNLVPGLKQCENLDGPVAHLGAIKATDIHFNERRMLLNRRGLPVNIVHQYDRHPDLTFPAP